MNWAENGTEVILQLKKETIEKILDVDHFAKNGSFPLGIIPDWISDESRKLGTTSENVVAAFQREIVSLMAAALYSSI